MASGPPDDGSILPEGWTWGDIGHGALDIGGLVPVFGEAADLANAVWYAAQGRYLEAGLSLVSMVPIVGDVIGKGGKLASKLGGPALRKLAKALKTMDFAKTLAPFRKNPKLAPHIDKMVAALERWRMEIIAKASGIQTCPKATKALGEVGATVSKTPVPVRILEKLTPAERKVFDEAVEELERFPVKAAENRAVFYSGMVGDQPAWKLVAEMEKAGTVDSVNTLTKGLLNRPAIRDVLPDDAMGFIDDVASRKLAEGASGVLKMVGDPNFIKPASVFRRIELPALLKNTKLAPESRQQLIEIQRFLDSKYGR